MNKHCPQLRNQLKNIQSLFSMYCLEFEQAKNSKEYDVVFDTQKQVKQEIDKLKFNIYINPEALMRELKQRLKLKWIDDFFEGRAVVEDDNYGLFYIDLNGKKITQRRFNNARRFSEGRAPVKDDLGWFYIDLNGEEIISKRFNKAGNFTNGRAIVTTNNVYEMYFIDLDGNIIE